MAGWAFWLASVGACLVVAAPVLYRVGVVPLGPALLAVPLGILFALVALSLSTTVLLTGRPTAGGRVRVVATVPVAALTGFMPLLIVLPGIRAPAIHDITTDTSAPPQFDAVVPLRSGAPNSLEYDAESAGVQREAYPGLRTLAVAESPERTVALSQDVALELGWDVVAVDPVAGRLEASDTTFWFGFTDDIVVRVRGVSDGSEVDLRSTSRVGVGDLGANAARIRAFLDRLSKAVER